MTVRSRRRSARSVTFRAPRGSRAVSSVARSPREGNIPVAPRIAVAGVLGAVVIGILVLRLWALTVLGGAEYAERADSNVIRKIPIAAQRGSILDRKGSKIVVNVEMRQVVLNLQDVEGKRLDQVIEDLGRVLAPNRFEVEETTGEIREIVDNAPPGAIEPVIVARDVQREEVIHYLAEHAAEFPGVDIRAAFRRSYRHKTAAAHVLGQVGAVDEADLEAHPTLQPIDKVGKSGLEKRYDEYLRGANGYDAVQVDAAGVRTDAVGIRGLPPTPGRNLRLTIDLNLQKTAEKSLVRQIRHAASTADGRDARSGAAVAIDPRNGDVLAIVSAPFYDPNVFGSSRPADQRLVTRLNDPNNKLTPLLNRAIAGAYPPASTYKVITGMAAMSKGWITEDTLLGCEPSMLIGGVTFRNHSTLHHGAIDLPTALEMSCDTYFYKLALHFYNDPKSPLQAWSRKFGLGAPTGIDVPGEIAGLVPTPAWKREHFEGWEKTWSSGDSVNMSIGQGNLLVTPLQMTNVFATIANGGKLYTPRVAAKVETPGGLDQVEFPRPEPVDLNLDPGDLAAVVEGLVRVNSGGEGTATPVFDSFPIPTAGKTGTAEVGNKQNPRSDHAWYCGFAPVNDPTIAACAFIDGGGHGGSEAGPVVRDMFAQWFNVDAGSVGVTESSTD